MNSSFNSKQIGRLEECSFTTLQLRLRNDYGKESAAIAAIDGEYGTSHRSGGLGLYLGYPTAVAGEGTNTVETLRNSNWEYLSSHPNSFKSETSTNPDKATEPSTEEALEQSTLPHFDISQCNSTADCTIFVDDSPIAPTTNAYSGPITSSKSYSVSVDILCDSSMGVDNDWKNIIRFGDGMEIAYVSDGHADAAYDYLVRNFFFVDTASCSDPCDELVNCFNIVNSCAIAPAQDNLLATVPAALSYKASSEVFCDHSAPTNSEYTSVLRLGAGPNYGAPGDRTFLLLREPSGHQIHFAINHPDNIPTWAHQIYTDVPCVDGQWSTYTIEVTDAGNGQVNYVASVDGSIVMSGSYASSGSKSTGNLTAYVADNWEVFYGGVDMSYENREGGAECASESSLKTRAWEVLLVTGLSYLQFKFAEERCRKYYLENESELNAKKIESSSRRQIMLLILAMTWGMEIAFKLVEGKLIFLLNPCHLFTALQLYFLAGKPSKTMHILFQAHVPVVFGAFLAMILPDTDSRLLPLQREVYWVQHMLIWIIPAYLAPLGGVFRIEKDWSWTWLGLSFLQMYHSIVLQGFSLLFSTNLNHMLCAHKFDPFKNFNYRIFANGYCLFLCWLHSGLYSYVFKGIKGVSQDGTAQIEDKKQTVKAD
ncbi:Oidioi.mRNA.OKI2018_I69.chr1.g1594.t1.cds [Oikopleura dioica]|uniref:Oidioi.mRNA.OKI2018_I69.chr1.g1594.t1.cds n=1 Tax=Oikopleura dioica TaxID=34765 RepID=A0ABN7SRX3_OIKDI|nr:Oidioi.mRNA.OKI2018_I69.chr1.g1594.t1.cds [Oikopleura dioica]